MALQAYKEIMEMLESQSFEIKAFSFGVNLGVNVVAAARVMSGASCEF